MQTATQRKLHAATDPAPARPELLDALRALSTFEAPATLGARRALRSTVERQGLALNHRLLAAFGGLQTELDAAGRELDALCEASGSAVARLQTTRAATEVLISQTSRLKEQLRQAAQRERLAVALAEALNLSPEHEAVLNAPQGAALSLDDLLEALDRVRLVGGRGRTLLGGKFGTLGLQVTNQMRAYEERGYTAIFRWVAAAAPRLPPDSSDEALSQLRRAVASLSTKPEMLSVCLQELAAARRDAHLRAFSRSLAAPPVAARGGGLAAVASALAGVLHQLVAAVAAEKRLLDSLFLPRGSAAPPALGSAALEASPVATLGPRALDGALVTMFERVAPLLTSHVEALLRPSLPIPLTLRLALQLRSAAAEMHSLFLRPEAQSGTAERPGAMEGLAVAAADDGGGAGGEHDDATLALGSAFSSCAALASARFFSALEAHTSATLRGATRVPPDLSAPPQLVSLSLLLEELLETCAAADAEADARAARAGAAEARTKDYVLP